MARDLVRSWPDYAWATRCLLMIFNGEGGKVFRAANVPTLPGYAWISFAIRVKCFFGISARVGPKQEVEG